MRQTPTFSILMLTALLLSAFLLTGCSQDDQTPLSSNAPADDYAGIDFAQTYGGLTASDEDVAFGDEALLEMSLAEEGDDIADPMADDPQVREMERAGRRAYARDDSTRPQFTFVHLRWGHLRDVMDSVSIEPPCAVTDWTGSVNIDRGFVVVRRTIRFERPADHIIFPRLDRQTVGLVSQTACGFDGIVLQIMERPDDPATDLAPNTLHIALGGFSLDIPVAELAGLAEVYDVDADGNQFGVSGFTLSDVEVCPKGFLSGHYRRLPTDRPDSLLSSDEAGERYGTLAGLWRGLDGRVDGFLRGGYGLTPDGERVFIAKVIGRRGHFRGLVRGTWQPGDDDRDLTEFNGQWVSANGNVEGLLGGEAYPVAGSAGGFFSGRWTTLCDEQAEESLR